MNTEIAKKRINEVVRPDTMTTSREDFLATHVSVHNIELYSKFDPNDSSKSIRFQEAQNEEDVFNQFILNPGDNHQFLLVVGESGAGKSHLIRWFNERLLNEKPEDEVILFVSRSDNTLKGTIKQLLDKPEISNLGNKEVYERLVNATSVVDENKLKSEILSKFIIEIEHDQERDEDDNGDAEKELSPNERRKLVAFLKYKKIQSRMLEIEGPIDRIYMKVAQSGKVVTDVDASFLAKDFEFDDDDLEEIFEEADKDTIKMARKLSLEPDKKKNIAKYLNTFIDIVIQRCSGLEAGDFEEIFKDIRRNLKKENKRLTILIEDITSFTGVNAALLNALTGSEHTKKGNEDLCRLSSIVGITSGYYKDVFKTNHRDRVNLFINLPNDIFSEEYLYEYVAKYLNAMSLERNRLFQWMESGALPEDYPVHEVTEGKDREFVTNQEGKKLNLYPFSKLAIKNLYKYRLSTTQLRTPRYILQYIIEPIVKDVLYHKSSFPNTNLKIYNLNDSFELRTKVFNLPDTSEEVKERLYLFACIWGTGQDNTVELDNGVKIIAGLPASVYEEFGLPVLTNLKTTKPHEDPKLPVNPKPPVVSKPVVDPKPPVNLKPDNGQIKKINSAIDVLNKWVGGSKINVGATTDNVVLLSNARDDIAKYLISAINWQSEGVSPDNISKILASKYKNFIGFENQTSGLDRVLFVLKAERKSQEIIEGFIRWSVLGNKSWNFAGGDYFALSVETWTESIKKELIKSIQYVNNGLVNYQQYAFASEIYRQIFFGQVNSDWNNYSSDMFIANDTCEKDADSNHSSDWNKLLDTIISTNKHKENREVVLQYYNLIQGSRGGSKLYFDRCKLDWLFYHLKEMNLKLDCSEEKCKDFISTRDEFRIQFEKISSRVEKAYKSELEKVNKEKEQLEEIAGCFYMESDEILQMINNVKDYYDEVNAAQLYAVYDADLIKSVRDNRNEISQALKSLCDIIEEKDIFNSLILMSHDPMKKIRDYKRLVSKVYEDMKKVSNQMKNQGQSLVGFGDNESQKTYLKQKNLIDDCIKVVERLGQ